MIIHLIDGTYELFRHFYGLGRFTRGKDPPFGAVVGVLTTLLQMIENGATHLGVATDHVIESFRNELWSAYKTGDGIDPALRAQFDPLEQDRKSKAIRNAEGVRAKFGVDPERIPDYLALVGDRADGYPGIAGIGAKGAASLIHRYGPIEAFPAEALGKRGELAQLFKRLAMLRTDTPLFADVEALRWRGPAPTLADCARNLAAPRLLERALKAAVAHTHTHAVTPAAPAAAASAAPKSSRRTRGRDRHR